MADVNRWESGDKNCISVHFLSGTTVEMGDLIFLDNADGLRGNGSSTASQTGFPISWLRASGASLEYNKSLVKDRLLGVAMSGKDGGDNVPAQNIAVATTGIFELDLSPPATVKVGEMVGPSGTTVGSKMYDQKVMLTTKTANAIGYIAENKLYAQSAKVLIKTKLGQGVIN